MKDQCILKDCHVKPRARGLCFRHYMQAKRRVDKNLTTWDALIAEDRALEADPQQHYVPPTLSERMKTPTLPATEAQQLGYRPLTTAYNSKEKWMMDNVISDMSAGGIETCLVRVTDGLEVWRKGWISQSD